METKSNSGGTKRKAQPPMEELEIGNALYKTRLTEKFRNRKSWVRPDLKLVLAVIPGTIQKVMVKEGDEILAGDPLLILEAMKMRNVITAGNGGVVKKVNVSTGDLVAKGQVLVEFR